MISTACRRRHCDFTHPLFALVVGLLIVAGAGDAAAQAGLPRIGLSASPDVYVDQITVEYNTDFLLYAMIFGAEDGVPLQESVSHIPWVIHQVCCGAVLNITAVEYNPALQHSGNPLAGTTTTAPDCLQEDAIWLATLTVRLESPEAGDFEWAAGPFASVLDCDNEAQFMRGLAVTVTLEESPTPADLTNWGQLKALYR